MTPTKPTFDQALTWIQEWIKERHPTKEMFKVSKSRREWCDEFSEYVLLMGDFEEARLRLQSVEIVQYPIFEFPVPATKEELFTVLSILDK